MNHFFTAIVILALTLGGQATYAYQDQGADDAPVQEEDESEATERRDEQYRRRMELEDAQNRADDVLTQTTYENEANKSKLAKLPRESQEHLKEQMKEIIIEGEQWTPADAGTEYPYEPSEAAKSDADLAQREQEAWKEMVEGYHQREAAAHAAQQQAGAGSQVADNQSQQGSPGGSQGSEGQQDSADAGRGGGTYDPNAADSASDDEETYTAGVSQSALDFLKNRGGGANAGVVLEEGQPGPGGSHPEGVEDGHEDGTAPYGSSEEIAASGDDQGEQDGGGEEGRQADSPPGEQLLTAGGPQGPDGSLPISELNRLQGMPGAAGDGAPNDDSPGIPATRPASAGGADSLPSLAEASPSAPPPPVPQQQAEQQLDQQLAQQQEQQQSADSEPQPEQDEESAAETMAENSEPQQQTPAAPVELNLETPGIIAIKDLDKLEGVESPPDTR